MNGGDNIAKSKKTEEELIEQYKDSVKHGVDRTTDWIGTVERVVMSKKYGHLVNADIKNAIVEYLRVRIDKLENTILPAETVPKEGFNLEND